MTGSTIYSKTLHPLDYSHLPVADVEAVQKVLTGLAPQEHPHRRWEYATALQLIRDEGAKRVLDVGGGFGAFAQIAAFEKCGVTVVDPRPVGDKVQRQSDRLGTIVRYMAADFLAFPYSVPYDLVTCISVLEHIEKDVEFFERLLVFVKPGGVLFCTVDFSESGRAFCREHLRTYTVESWAALMDEARMRGFELYSDRFEYDTAGEHVNGYNFASIILRRKAAA